MKLTAKHIAQPHHYVAMVDGFSYITISGQDATPFLQGQLTCDVTQLSPYQAQVGAYCDHKGRVIANFWIWRDAQTPTRYQLLLPFSMQELICKPLYKYKLFSKVLIEHDDYPASALLYCHLNAIPAALENTTVGHGSLPLLLTHMPQRRLSWFMAKAENLTPHFKELQKTAPVMDQASSEWLQLLSGLCFIQPDTSEQFLPQMLNLEQQGAISFRKGCYVGQEVITRTQHLGKLKRRLYFCTLDSRAIPYINAPIKNAENDNLGTMVAIAQPTDSRYECLAVIHDQAHQQTLYCNHQPIIMRQPVESYRLPSR